MLRPSPPAPSEIVAGQPRGPDTMARRNSMKSLTSSSCNTHNGEEGVRGYFVPIMEALRCHQDLQIAHGRYMLIKYVTKYVAKWSDSSYNCEVLSREPLEVVKTII